MVSVHFYKANTFLGRLVRYFGKTEYVHCAIQIDSKHIIETDFRKRIAMNHISKRADMVLFFEMNELEEKLLLTRYNNIAGSEYDNHAIGSFLGDIAKKLFKQNPKKYTCVELVCEMLDSIGFRFENKNMKPDQLFNILSEGKYYGRTRTSSKMKYRDL